MARQEREDTAKRVCNFYEDAASHSVKTTINYFKKCDIPERTLRYILKKYLTYETTKFLPRKGRPVKINDWLLNELVSTINNKTGLSQRQIARRYNVHQSTINRTLRKRTSVLIRKRRKEPKMNSDNQEKTARKKCGKLYRMILNACDIILDDEKYVGLSGDNVQCNQRVYTTDPSTTPSDITSVKLAADSSISCRHSFCYLGWPCNYLHWMQNFVLYRLVTDSKGVVDQKFGVSAKKPCKIPYCHRNLCRHSLENVSRPSKLYRSTQNFMLDRLVTDSRGVVGQK